MPRKIPPNYRSITGRLACYSSESSLEHESLLEKDFLLLFTSDHTVEDVKAQPVTIRYHDAKGRPRSYTPDACVRFMDDDSGKPRPHLLVEVKFRSDLRDQIAELRPKFRAAHHHARERGGRFRVFHEGHLRTPRLQNVKFLRPFLRGPRDREAADRLLGALRRMGQSTPRRLLDTLGTDADERARLTPTLWRLLASREIAADLDSAPLTMEANLRPGASASIR